MSRREAVGLVELALRLPGFRFGACFLAAFFRVAFRAAGRLRAAFRPVAVFFFFARLRVFVLAAIGGFSFSSGTVWWRTWIGLALR
jgi:hypothetical protein